MNLGSISNVFISQGMGDPDIKEKPGGVSASMRTNDLDRIKAYMKRNPIKKDANIGGEVMKYSVYYRVNVQ